MEYLTDQDYEIAASNGISKKNAYRRFYIDGWSKQRTITTPVIKKEGVWKHWREKAESNGINIHTFQSRLELGWTPEEAASHPVGTKLYPPKNRKVTKEQLEIAKNNGLCENTVRSRIHIYKWPVEKAISLPKGTRYRKSSGWV